MPLKNYKGDAKLYFGLVHHDDEDGDRQRIRVAQEFIKDFGVGTECGWGRTDPKRVPGLLASHRRAAEALNANTLMG